MDNPSRFIATLADALSRDPLREKIILAPSHRVGRQWLDQAAAASGGFANVRAVTMKRLTLDLAEPGLRRRNLRPAASQEKIRLVGIALGQLAEEGKRSGYFTRLPFSLNLAEMLLASLEELEHALVKGTRGFARSLTPREKADELTELAKRYHAARKSANLAGNDDIREAALEALATPDSPSPLLLIPESLFDDFTAAEQAVVAAWPETARQRLPEEETGCQAEPFFFTADSIANEAREVFRRVQELGVPLDRVEVVCLDQNAYIPALCAAGLEMFGGRPEDLPITCNGGLPGSFARPVRLLAAWLEWLEQGLPPEGLARMLEAELVDAGWRERAPEITAAALASRLRALPINGGPGEYRRRLGMGDGECAVAEAWLARLLPEILPLANGGDSLDLADAPVVLEAAEKLLHLSGRHEGKLDAYARTSLLDNIALWRSRADWPGFDAFAWLSELAGSLRIMGLGPLPGRLHVGDLYGGGHSGREFTFIMGLDDTRHPGAIRQDPVLLDRERAGLSPHLPRSGRQRQRREKALARLLSRLRGRVFLSYAKREAGGERELYPAAIFAKWSGSQAGAGGASLAPDRPEKCLNRRDDWLSALLAKPRNSLTPAELRPWFPNLAEGEKALQARLSASFTEYDGRVPEAGLDFFRDGQAVSPTDLEIMAACPLEFFFKRMLGIRPPDRHQPTAGRWLEGNVRGSLLHDLFQEFLTKLEETGRRVDRGSLGEHAKALSRLLESAIERHRRKYPPPDRLAAEREERELREACGIFLESEIARQAMGRPLYMEVSLGGDRAVTPWDRSEPVAMGLGSGRTLRLRGRMDRIDRLDGGGLFIIDYKSGRSDKFSKVDPFRQGRNLQPFLYTRMLERAVEELGRPEPVRGFAYYFPMPRDEGRTIAYSRAELDRGGMEIVERLAGMMAGGCFPFTTDGRDVEYSDYLTAFGDAGEMAAAARRKALADSALAEWAALRELDAE